MAVVDFAVILLWIQLNDKFWMLLIDMLMTVSVCQSKKERCMTLTYILHCLMFEKVTYRDREGESCNLLGHGWLHTR